MPKKHMIALVAALKEEISSILKDMNVDEKIVAKPGTIYRGKLHSKEIVLVQTGVGIERAKAATKAAINYFRPEKIINIGCAGALMPGISAGCLIIADKTYNMPKEMWFFPNLELIEAAKLIAQDANLKFKVGSTITVEKTIGSPHEKAYFGTKFEAFACDMESASVAEAAADENIPFVAVRAIFDSFDTPLVNFGGALESDGEINIGAAISHIIKKPKDLLKIPHFQYLMSQARDSITTFVNSFLAKTS